jgi:hypothetical protein
MKTLETADYLVKEAFLRLLERDLPTHILCPHCNNLHSILLAKHYLPSESRHYITTTQHKSPCWLADVRSNVFGRIHPNFSTTVFRMAMKAHRQGHETSKLLSLLSYRPANIINWGFSEHQTTVVRIQGDSLLVRDQIVFMVSKSQKLPLPWTGGIEICPHMHFMTMFGLYMHGIEIPHADDIEGYENKQGMLYCDYCYTEFRVDFKSYGEIGNAMFVTKWMDMGEGRDVNDKKLRSRLGMLQERTWAGVTFRRGSICAAFEQEAETTFKFDSVLSSQDRKNLLTKNPWQWPEDREISFKGIKQYWVVRHGQFLPSTWERRNIMGNIFPW